MSRLSSLFSRPVKPATLLSKASAAAVLLLALLFCAPVQAAEKYTPANMNEIESMVSRHKGDIILLNVFASWCPPCAQESHNFVQFHRRYPPNSGVRLYGISLDEDTAKLEAFLDKQNINFPVYHCGQDFVDYFEIESIPTLIVIDRTGSLVEYRIGIASLKELTDIVDKYK